MRRKNRLTAGIALMLGTSAVLAMPCGAAANEYSIDMTGRSTEAWEHVAMTNDDRVTTGVCIRKEASATSAAVGFLYRGGAVTVLDRGKTWTEVESGGLHGYIRSEYLTFGEEAKGLAEYYGNYGVEAAWDDVKVFSWDDPAAKIIATASSGDTYEIVNNNGHWIEVRTGEEETAYVSADDVSLVILVDTAYSVDDKEGRGAAENAAKKTAKKTAAKKEEAVLTETAEEQRGPAEEEMYTDTDGSAAQESWEAPEDGDQTSAAQTAGVSETAVYEETPAYTEAAYEAAPAYTEAAYEAAPAYTETAYEAAPAYTETAVQEVTSAGQETASGEDVTAGKENTAEADGDNDAWEAENEAAEDDQDEDAEEDADDEEALSDEEYDEEDVIIEDELEDDFEDAGEVEADESYEDLEEADTVIFEDADDTVIFEDAEQTVELDDEYDNESGDDEWSDDETYDEADTSVSSSDLDLLAGIIYCEAGNQPYEGQVAVGAVVMNRVASGSFPNTISEVIYQSGQFTPAGSGTLASALSGGMTASYYDAANAALAGQDPTGGCLYFNAVQGSGVKIGDHWFY